VAYLFVTKVHSQLRNVWARPRVDVGDGSGTQLVSFVT